MNILFALVFSALVLPFPHQTDHCNNVPITEFPTFSFLSTHASGRLQFSLKKSGSRKTPDITVGVVQAVELDAKQQSKADCPDAYISVELASGKKVSASGRMIGKT